MRNSTVFEEAFVNLETAYQQHCRFNPISDVMVQQWKEKLGVFPDEALKRAFDEHIKLSEKFPQISDIRFLANKHSKRIKEEKRRHELQIEYNQAVDLDSQDAKRKAAKRSIEVFNKLVKELAENPKKDPKPRKRPDSVTRTWADGRPINLILRTDPRSGIQYEYIQFLDTVQ